MKDKSKHLTVLIFAMISIPILLAACGGCGGGGGNGEDGDTTIDIPFDDFIIPDTYDVPDDQPIDTPVETDIPPDTPAGCSPPCTEGSCCSGSCVDLGSDPANCGTCGNICSGGQMCVAGECRDCAPDCAGKECGNDGCGGSCGDCRADEACMDGSCEPCPGSCEGRDCGDDGCGHSCGTCPAGETCSEGTCVDCDPDCTGADCGDDDGCGGRCDGDCPGGGTCDDGVCVGGCIPDCSGRECGNDGCGGSCGECAYPAKCSRSGICECTPLCSIEGRECGFDGCGGSCGTCPEGEICADGASGAVVPTFQCIDLSVGCADGTREGFTNQSIYPDIASCKAAWTSQSMRTTRTGALCGNSLGPCMVPEDACSPGWHLCMKNGWPGDMADRITGEDCHSPIAGDTYFVGGSSSVRALNDCTLPLQCDGWDIICCGTGCHDNSSMDDCVWPGMTRHVGWSDCNTFQSTDYGVLCCQDPPVVGH